MAHDILDFVDRFELVGQNSADHLVAKLGRKDVQAFKDAIRAVLSLHDFDTSQERRGLFNFFASASFRGDVGCTCADCKRPRLAHLARFSALYSDQLLVPIPISSCDTPSDKANIASAILTVNELRPLLEAEIVFLMNQTPLICKHCYPHVEDRYMAIYRRAELVGEKMRDLLKRKFVFVLRSEGRGQKRSYYVEAEGPVDYIPDGRSIVFPHGVAKSEFRGLRLNAPVPFDTPLWKTLSRFVFTPNAEDFWFQGTTASRLGCTYLTNSESERRFFALAMDDKEEGDRYQAAGEAIEHLTHDLPLFSSVDTATILKVRSQDGDVFQNYRISIANALQAIYSEGHPTPAISRQLYGDVVLPSLSKLHILEKNLVRKRRREAVGQAVFPVATVLLGLVSQRINPTAGTVINALGGASFLSNMYKQYEGAKADKEDLRQQDYYFLLKLENEMKRKRTRRKVEIPRKNRAFSSTGCRVKS